MPVLDDRYRGLAPTILIIIVVWAVAAVLMLTGTLVAARQIDDRVNNDITVSVPEIDKDTDNVKLAARTAEIAKDILPAVDNISNQLTRVEDEATSINRRVPQILSTARSINGTVRQIEREVVGQIGPTVQGIGGSVQSIGAHVQSIHGSVRSIRASGGGILSTVAGSGGIERGVANINARADRGIAVVGAIAQDLEDVLLEVGPGHEQVDETGRFAGGASIHGHANSIDCRIQALTSVTFPGSPGPGIPVIGPGGGTINLNPSGASPYCNR